MSTQRDMGRERGVRAAAGGAENAAVARAEQRQRGVDGERGDGEVGA